MAPERWTLGMRLFVAAQIAAPVIAHVCRWITGIENWWGWMMFSR